MASDIQDWTTAVNITGGSVSIAGTATVTIVGTTTVNIGNTPTVFLGAGTASVGSISAIGSTVTVAGTINIGNVPAVTISGTPTVNIGTGTVTIANASIAVINAAGTKITSSRPPKEILNLGATANFTQNVALDADVQALVFELTAPLANWAHLKAVWHPTGGTFAWVPFELYSFQQAVYVVPILPANRDSLNNLDTQLDVTVTAVGGQTVSLSVWALYEANPTWLQVFPQPQMQPNQAPFLFSHFAPGLAVGTAEWLVAPVANVQISIFDITTTYVVGAGAQYFVGYAAVLPLALPAANLLFMSGNTGAFLYEFHGAQLPRGNGIFLWNNGGAALQHSHLLNYSLS